MKNALKSFVAVLVGFFATFFLSVITDKILETIGILPSAFQPQAYRWWHLMLALLYRSLITVVGGYLTARLSPGKAQRDAVILAVIGTVLGILGTAANWDKAVLSGTWYPIALLVASPVCIMVGAKIWMKSKKV